MDTFKYEVLDSILSYRYLVTEMEHRCGRIVLALLKKPCYGCTSASLSSSSKNHMSLADLVMVGPGKLMVVYRP